jgi:CubicO group peptidase (beta-lactamase class C family)
MRSPGVVAVSTALSAALLSAGAAGVADADPPAAPLAARAAPGSKPPAPPRDFKAMLAPLAKSLVDGQYCGGVVVALIPAGGGAPQILAWGETVRGNGVLPDGRTVFEIGSVTKVFTSLLLALAVNDKQVGLDQAVATLLPPGTKLPAGKRAITLLDLATHTSGLARMPDNLAPKDPANPYADYTNEQLFGYLAGAALASEPGAKYEYSNLGAALLGQALARRAKTEWAALIAAEITGPLAMTNTTVALGDAARARFAQGYDAEGEPAKPWDLPTFAGAGALRSTASDLIGFVQAELAAAKQPGSRLARAMALSQKPQRDIGGSATGKIGLGWHLQPDGLVWHNGQTGGFHSFVGFSPDKQVGAIVLASGGSLVIDKLGNAAIAALTGGAIPPALGLPPPDTAVDAKTLESYVGNYPLAPTFVIEISRTGDKLYGQATGQPRFRLHATSQRDFAVHVVPASVTFEVDGKGKVTGLVLHQNGHDQRAPRQ